MSSRDAILKAIRENRPPESALPDVGTFPRPEGDLCTLFMRAIEAAGGYAVEAARDGVAEVVAERYPEAQVIASTVPDLDMGTLRPDEVEDPHELASLDVLVCEGMLGVAENGAVWLSEARMGHRAAPFLTQHLVLVLDRERIVWNMHEAYAQLEVVETGFGLFVAGPSKTADIEQSLVIGAHGPRSLTVVLV